MYKRQAKVCKINVDEEQDLAAQFRVMTIPTVCVFKNGEIVDKSICLLYTSSDDVFVFTPKGEVITLVRGATPIDFAYRIHSKVGDSCVGCKANGRIVPLDYQRQTGDVVEILTSGSKGPSRDWLNVAKTSQAKSRIRQWFKRALREENIAKGRDMLEKACLLYTSYHG